MQLKKRLDWNQYTFKDFETICYEYVCTIYESEFYHTELTRAVKDGGFDIKISSLSHNQRIWAECKHHTRNIDLSAIGKNIVLAISKKINKVIFFSVSPITIQTKIEILLVAQINGFEVLFLDGNVLDNRILTCVSVASRYFHTDYIQHKSTVDSKPLIVETALSEFRAFDCTLDIEREQYELKNGCEIYLNVLIKNNSQNKINNAVMKVEDRKTDIIFAEDGKISFSIEPFSDFLYTIHGYVLKIAKDVKLPTITISFPYNELHDITVITGSVNSERVWSMPLVGKNLTEFLSLKLHNAVNDVTQLNTRCIYLHGASGMGKSRLIQEIRQKLITKAFRTLLYDFNCSDSVEIQKRLIFDILCIPSSYTRFECGRNSFNEIAESHGLSNILSSELYDFLYENSVIDNEKYLETIYALTLNSKRGNPLMISFDNIQSARGRFQDILCRYLQKLKFARCSVLLVFSENTDQNLGITPRLASYLQMESIHDSANFILEFQCSPLEKAEAVMLMNTMLGTPEKDNPIIEMVIDTIGTVPLDILLISKIIRDDSRYLDRSQNEPRFSDACTIERLLAGKNQNTYHTVIAKRIETAIRCNCFPDQAKQIISLLVFFDGRLTLEALEALGFSKDAIDDLRNSLIIKLVDNNFRFYHDSIFSYCKNLVKFSATKKDLLIRLEKRYQSGDTVGLSEFDYIKMLIRLDQKNQALELATKIYNAAIKKDDLVNVYRITSYMLPICKDRRFHFELLLNKARACVETINNFEAEELYNEVYKEAQMYKGCFGYDLKMHYEHTYCNFLLHNMRYSEGLSLLQDIYSCLDASDEYTRWITIEDRLCTAYYSLGEYEKSIEHINNAIEIAKRENNIFWLSTAYSDEAYAYLITGKSSSKAADAFEIAVNLYDRLNDQTGYRKHEINLQDALADLLKGKIAKASEKADKAVESAEREGYMYQLIPALNFQAYIRMRQNDLRNATEILKKATKYAEAFSMTKSLIAINNMFGCINYLSSPDAFETSIPFFKDAEEKLNLICKPCDSYRFLGCIENLILCYSKTKKEDKIDDILKKYNSNRLNEYYKALLTKKSKTIPAQSLLSFNELSIMY